MKIYKVVTAEFIRREYIFRALNSDEALASWPEHTAVFENLGQEALTDIIELVPLVEKRP